MQEALSAVGCRLSVGSHPVLLFVDGRHRGFHRTHQRGEIIPVGHVRRDDRFEDGGACLTGVEEFRSRPRDPIGTFEDDRKDREPVVDSDTERPFLERQQVPVLATSPLREHDQRVSTLRCELDPFVDGLTRRLPRGTVDLDDPDRPHRSSYEGDLEDLLLGQEPSMEWNGQEEHRDVEHREVVRDDDVSLRRIYVVRPLDGELHRGDLEEEVRPPLHDPVVDGRGRSEGTVCDDDGGVHERVEEEQGNHDDRAE